jgi:hypothetical protein
MPAGDRTAERPALTDEVLLADELLEVARPHPGGERLLLGRRLEKRLGFGAGRSGRGAPGWHEPDGTRLGGPGRPDPLL